MSIAAELHTEQPQDGRSAGRKPVGVRAGFRKRGYENARADLLDISATGFRIDSSMALGIDTDVWLRLPGLEPKAAKVVWVRGFIAGCEFIDPMHEAVLENILGQIKANR